MNKLLKKIRRIPAKLRSMRIIDQRQFYTFQEENHLRRLFEVLEVDCVFDVGANYGQYATMLREKVGYTGQIISFEPMPDAITKLRQMSAGDPRWRIEELALAKSTGTTTFNVMEHDQFSSLGSPNHDDVSIFRKKNAIRESIIVRTETLSDALVRLRGELNFDRPFLKMDTQGFDVEVFESGKEMIKEFVGLQSELAFKKLYNESKGYAEALSVYVSGGFAISALVPNNAGHFPQLVEMDTIMLRQDLL